MRIPRTGARWSGWGGSASCRTRGRSGSSIRSASAISPPTTTPTSPPEICASSPRYAWLFLRDDKGNESAEGRNPNRLSAADSRLLDTLEGAEPGEEDEPLAHALCDLRERVHGYLRANVLPGVWMRRLVRAVREHLEATLWEAANRARGSVPPLESYVRMCPLTGGLSIVTELVEIVEGSHLPAEVREQKTVRRMTEASHNITCWANDIISLEKELAAGEVNNLILVLREERGLTLQQAVDEAAQMHDTEVLSFIEASCSLPRFGPAVDETLGRYVSSLEARMRGVLDWSYGSERYRLSGRVSTVPSAERRSSSPPPSGRPRASRSRSPGRSRTRSAAAARRPPARPRGSPRPRAAR